MPLQKPHRRKSVLTRMKVSVRLLPSGPVKRPGLAGAGEDAGEDADASGGVGAVDSGWFWVMGVRLKLKSVGIGCRYW
jgi:hypothetical protein